MRSALTPNFFSTPASSSVSFDMVLTSVMPGLTSWVMSLSPVEITTRMPSRSACLASVPITSSASTPSTISSGQPIAADGFVQGRDLRDEVVGHRRPVRLVLGIKLVAERLAFCVENAGAIIGGHVLVQPAQHVEHAIDRAGRLALLVAQVGHRVERAVKIGRTVNQQQSFHL